jgi:hypothetical protein
VELDTVVAFEATATLLPAIGEVVFDVLVLVVREVLEVLAVVEGVETIGTFDVVVVVMLGNVDEDVVGLNAPLEVVSGDTVADLFADDELAELDAATRGTLIARLG